MKWLLRWLTELSSRKTLSKMAGALARSKISKRFIPRFVNIYGIRVEEAEKPVSEYGSLNEFFTRRLKPGARPLAPNPTALISPVDGEVTGLGKLEAGRLLHVKGQHYEVEELLNHSPRAVNYRHGYFLILYLSPADYHRIHAPASGDKVETEHVPGRVYPVNRFAMRHIRGVLARNERLITYLRHETGEIAVVKVGAMNVSSIRYLDPAKQSWKRGEELACFEFGSTVVLLTEKGTFTPDESLREGMHIKMGQTLGVLHPKPKRTTVSK